MFTCFNHKNYKKFYHCKCSDYVSSFANKIINLNTTYIICNLIGYYNCVNINSELILHAKLENILFKIFFCLKAIYCICR